MLALFDDACVLCNGVARFVMANDPAGRVRFAPLASPTASEAAAAYGGLPAVDSIVVIDDAGVHARSDAVLRLLRAMRAPWPALAALLTIVPRDSADRIYDAIARNRGRWFGRS